MNDGSADGQTGADKNDGTTNRRTHRHSKLWRGIKMITFFLFSTKTYVLGTH